MNPYALIRPFLFVLDAEQAHELTLGLLAARGSVGFPPSPPVRNNPVKVMGLEFPNRVGLAAGLDKNGTAIDGLGHLAFGFLEVGTVTPRPQPGNPKPRLFRLPEDRALVNRMGFNNGGYAAALPRIEKPMGGLFGVNFGPNKDAQDRIADYVAGVRAFAPHADYLTINVSSPNTAGLRDLQRREAFDDLVARVIEARDATTPSRPLLIKIAPDLDLRELDDVVSVALARRADGLIVSNTTVTRPRGLLSARQGETGGLSGRPLFAASTRMLARAYLRLEGALPLIGVGGVEDSATAIAKIAAGASLIQIYTGFIYRGPRVIGEILHGLAGAIAARRLASIGALVGVEARDRAVYV